MNLDLNKLRILTFIIYKLLDTNKSPGPDCVESVYLKLATDFITSPLTYILIYH